MKRGAGVLLHISSLPTKYGIGTFGKEAYDFVKKLKELKIKYWQILPLNPTGYKDSPYQSCSAFAMNPYFIDLDMLIADGLLKKEDLLEISNVSNPLEVDYGFIYCYKYKILRIAFKNITDELKVKIKKFEKVNKYWIEDYANFMMFKTTYSQASFLQWEEKYKRYDKKAIKLYKNEHQEEYEFYIFIQYLAINQYKLLKKFANENGVMIIGDVPIYVSMDSCDLWANRKLFMLDQNDNPSLVAGVPPDYFSSTGQLWGNPLYNYDVQQKDDYAWWNLRLKHNLKLYDYIRIDHFRGFESFYAIPFAEKSAINGSWIKGPDYKLFEALEKNNNLKRIIVEDLGIITPEVKKLKDKFNFPGLKIVEFAFDEYNPQHIYLPKNYENNCVAYLGSHDNEPLYSYLYSNQIAIENIKKYYNNDADLDRILIDDLFASKARLVVLQMQDLLKGKERMNIPGSSENNWIYRIPVDYAKSIDEDYFVELIIKTKR